MLNSIIKNILKDFRVEFRNRYAVNISISFAVISTVAVSLALGGVPVPEKIQAALFWLILFFSAMNGLSHIFIREEEQETALFLRINSGPSVVLTSKLVFNAALFLILQVVVTPLSVFFLQMEVRSVAFFALSVIAGGIAISSSTTILASIVAKAGGRGSLFTVVSFPVILPVLWISINCTARSLADASSFDVRSIVFLLAFSATVITLSYLLFEHVWTEE